MNVTPVSLLNRKTRRLPGDVTTLAQRFPTSKAPEQSAVLSVLPIGISIHELRHPWDSMTLLMRIEAIHQIDYVIRRGYNALSNLADDSIYSQL